MTEEQINDLLYQLSRIADALEAAIPQQRPINPRQPHFEKEIRKIIQEELKFEKIKVPQK